MILENEEYTHCLFCELMRKVNAKATEIYKVVEDVRKEIGEIKGARQDRNESGANVAEKISDVMCKVEQLEEKIAGVEIKIDESEGFQIVRNGGKVKTSAKYSGIVTRNAFQVLGDEVGDEPSVTLVGDSIIRHQDEEFCKKGPRRKHFCYPGKKIEDITERVDDLVANSSEKAVFAYFIGSNNAKSGRSEEIMMKYKALIRKLKDSRRQSVICGLIPRYDVNPLTLSRMIGINTRVQDICQKEGVMFVDVWDHFNRDRSLYGKDGLNLSSVRKARLGRVLDESIRNKVEKYTIKLQNNQSLATVASQVRLIKEENNIGTVGEARHVVPESRQHRTKKCCNIDD